MSSKSLIIIPTYNERENVNAIIDAILNLDDNFLIKSQPHIIDSLLAINNFLLFSINKTIGFNPAIPGIAATQISDGIKIFFGKLNE